MIGNIELLGWSVHQLLSILFLFHRAVVVGGYSSFFVAEFIAEFQFDSIIIVNNITVFVAEFRFIWHHSFELIWFKNWLRNVRKAFWTRDPLGASFWLLTVYILVRWMLFLLIMTSRAKIIVIIVLTSSRIMFVLCILCFESSFTVVNEENE